MRRLILLLMILMLTTLIVACSDDSHVGKAKVSSKASTFKGKHYEDVTKDLEKSGFRNISTQKIDDLIFGWLKSDGDVETVSIDGDEEFESGTWYEEDVEVIIAYHIFPDEENKDDNEKAADSKNIDPEDKSEELDEVEMVYEEAEGEMASDVYHRLTELGYTVEFTHEVSKIDFTSEVLASDESEDEDYYIPWLITELKELNSESKKATFLINTQEMIDEAEKNDAMEKKLSKKLSPSTAWGTADQYGNKQYPYGFKLNMIKGMLAETAVDEDTWFLKSLCQTKNEYGEWMKDLTCEIYVSGTNESPKVVDFNAY